MNQYGPSSQQFIRKTERAVIGDRVTGKNPLDHSIMLCFMLCFFLCFVWCQLFSQRQIQDARRKRFVTNDDWQDLKRTRPSKHTSKTPWILLVGSPMLVPQRRSSPLSYWHLRLVSECVRTPSCGLKIFLPHGAVVGSTLRCHGIESRIRVVGGLNTPLIAWCQQVKRPMPVHAYDAGGGTPASVSRVYRVV